jgi:hypothetical protein
MFPLPQTLSIPATARDSAGSLRLPGAGVAADVAADAKRSLRIAFLGSVQVSWPWFLTYDLHALWSSGQACGDC